MEIFLVLDAVVRSLLQQHQEIRLEQSTAFCPLPGEFISLLKITSWTGKHKVINIISRDVGAAHTTERVSMVNVVEKFSFVFFKFILTVIATMMLPLQHFLYLLRIVNTGNGFFACSPIPITYQILFLMIVTVYFTFFLIFSQCFIFAAICQFFLIRNDACKICPPANLTRRLKTNYFTFLWIEVFCSRRFNFFTGSASFISIRKIIDWTFSYQCLIALLAIAMKIVSIGIKVLGCLWKQLLTMNTFFISVGNRNWWVYTSLSLSGIRTRFTSTCQSICMRSMRWKVVKCGREILLAFCTLLLRGILRYSIHDVSPLQMHPARGVSALPGTTIFTSTLYHESASQASLHRFSMSGMGAV
jgi:hypothetical protein